jgi:hypothetical protein
MEYYITQCIAGFIAFDENLDIASYKLFKEDEIASNLLKIEENEIYICANSNDALDRPLSSYEYMSLRVIHILGVRYDSRYVIDCFDSLYSPPLAPIMPPQDVPAEPETQQ